MQLPLKRARVLLLLLIAAAGTWSVQRSAAQSLAIGPSQAGAVNVPPCQFGEVSRARADARVSTRSQLEGAVAAGSRLIWIENGAAIDLSYVDHREDASRNYVLEVPPTVTLASGRSPTQPGGLLYFSRNTARPRFMLQLSPCSRVTGLRLRGPSRSTDRDLDPNVAINIRGVDNVLVDNNEFFDWPGAGVYLHESPNSYRSAHTIRVTGNFFHHNLRCGFGNAVQVNGHQVDRGIGGYAYIDRNVFNYNRHAVAGDGHPAIGYVAERNFVLSGGKKCYSDVPGGYYNQHFDMHGWTDRGYDGDAGEFMDIRHNTIRGEQKYYFIKTRPAFWLRGTPTRQARFYGNVLAHDDRSEALRIDAPWDSYDPTSPFRDFNNQYDVDTSYELAVGDFDGDGFDDVFQATGTVWVFSARGQSDWRVLNTRSERLSRLVFGDFDGNGTTDVFTQDGRRWLVSYGGVSAWTPLPMGSGVDMRHYRIGDFDGDGKADVFRATGTQWLYSRGGATDWERLARSGHREDQIRFADFDGNGTTDVFGMVGGQWKVAYGGSSGWQPLNDLISSNLGELVFADFNGDRRVDVARQRGADIQVSWSGRTSWGTLLDEGLKVLPWPLTSMLLGDFDGDRRADALHYERSVIDVGEYFAMSRGASAAFARRSRHEMR